MSLGLSEVFKVTQCTAKKTAANEKSLLEGDKDHVNIHYVPTQSFKASKEFIEQESHYGEPKLQIEFFQTCGKLYTYNGQKLEDDGLPPTFEIPADKEFFIGRLKKGNDLTIPSSKVSRKHSIIKYDEAFGWCLWEQKQSKPEILNTTSGTWVHPKNYAKAVAGDNSNPVRMVNGMRIRASSYVFEFLIQ